MDIASHIVSDEGWGQPSRSTDFFVVLGEHKILTAHLAKTLARLIKFRNILEDTPMLRTKSICAYLYSGKFFYILDFHSKSWIFQTEKGIIDTFVETIFFLADDPTTRCDDSPLAHDGRIGA